MRANGASDIAQAVVLIVEDEFFVRFEIANYLRDAGYIVVEAASAQGALAICRDQMPVHVLITDIQLNDPSLSGWDVADGFRAVRKDIPVIYTSGNTSDRTRSVPDSLFFNKPYRPAEVLSACQQFIAAGGSPE